MIREKCDVCGKEFDDRFNLTELYGQYQSPEVKEVCQKCRRRIEEVVDKVNMAMNPIKQNWIKDIIQRMMKNGHHIVVKQ